jgi:hypothetical protein
MVRNPRWHCTGGSIKMLPHLPVKVLPRSPPGLGTASGFRLQTLFLAPGRFAPRPASFLGMRKTRLHLAAWLCLAVTSAAAPAPRAFPTPEEWPAFRRDGSLQAHSPACGSVLSLPLGEAAQSFAAPALSPQSFLPKADWPNAQDRSATTTYADVLPADPAEEKIEFESGFNKPTVNGQWQPCSIKPTVCPSCWWARMALCMPCVE